ncbi:MAG: FeoB-associated Cys-rich membrane protein [Pirellulales bacterium]
MNFDWQNVIALGIVALAVGYVGRGLWRLVRAMNGKSSEGNCGSCGSCSASSPRQTIKIELPGSTK